jgi:molybdate transport system permease protein
MLDNLLKIDFTPFFISFKLASITTIILFFIALPLAWWLSQTKSKFKPFIEAFSAMPIVLPPSVLGFYLLVAFSKNSFLGKFLSNFNIELLFSFSGLVVASIIYSFPFMLQPLQSGFEGLKKSMIESSYVAGKGRVETLFYVALPNIKPSLLTALIVTFAHTVGEFGVVLMVGGSIPGQTKVASVAIYEMVETMEYNIAHIYSAIMLLISFTVLLSIYIFNRKSKLKAM